MPEGRTPVVFRLPRPSYLLVLFLVVGVWPIALYGGADDGGYASPAKVSPLTLLFLLPVAVAVFIARTGTVVTSGGIVVRAALGRRLLSWEELRGLSITGRSVYAVLPAGSVRLPCVGVPDLGRLARASDGRLPEIADPVRKAPARRRRR